MNKVSGVGKDAPTVVNERGGKQSNVLYRFDLLDPQAMFKMTGVLKEGAEKYGEDNWRNISVREHLNHLIIHAYAYLAGDTSDDHLSHIMCRAMFAQAVDFDEQYHEEERLNCAICGRPTIPAKHGIHSCSECGVRHIVTSVRSIDGPEEYFINTVKDGGFIVEN